MNIRGIEVIVNPIKDSPRELYAATATAKGMVAHSVWNERQEDAIEHAVWQIENGYGKPIRQFMTGISKPSSESQLVIGNPDEWLEYNDWKNE